MNATAMMEDGKETIGTLLVLWAIAEGVPKCKNDRSISTAVSFARYEAFSLPLAVPSRFMGLHSHICHIFFVESSARQSERPKPPRKHRRRSGPRKSDLGASGRTSLSLAVLLSNPLGRAIHKPVAEASEGAERRGARETRMAGLDSTLPLSGSWAEPLETSSRPFSSTFRHATTACPW